MFYSDFSHDLTARHNIIFFNLCFHYIFTGLLYLAMKHLVDRYNLYFNYRPPAYNYVDSNVHHTAVTFAVISTFFLLLSLLFYSSIRLGKYDTSVLCVPYQSNFQMSVESDPALRYFSLHSVIAPAFQPIKCRSKTNRDLFTFAFSRFRKFTCFYLEFSLAPCYIFILLHLTFLISLVLVFDIRKALLDPVS